MKNRQLPCLIIYSRFPTFLKAANIITNTKKLTSFTIALPLHYWKEWSFLLNEGGTMVRWQKMKECMNWYLQRKTHLFHQANLLHLPRIILFGYTEQQISGFQLPLPKKKGINNQDILLGYSITSHISCPGLWMTSSY